MGGRPSEPSRRSEIDPSYPAGEQERWQQVQFERLLADTSTRLLNLPIEKVDQEVGAALQRLGEHLGVDHASLGVVDPADQLVRSAYTWAAAGFATMPLLRETDVPWVAAHMRRGETLIVSRPDEIPPEAVHELAMVQHIGVHSIALLPLSAAGRLVGAMHFSTVSRELHWPEAFVQRLRLIGEMFAAVLLRRESDIELRRALADVQGLSDRLKAENAYLREGAIDSALRGDLVGGSKPLANVLTKTALVAGTDTTVLIFGETGVGKELIAKAIHEQSPRREATLVKVNCAALPASLIESELFGHEKGAFTGATARKLGRFELADGATIFLDEVGEIPLELQAKLLRVLQDGEIERIGSQETRRVNVRVVAATNRDLKAASTQGTFRADLYYRLAVFPIEIPPLRQRREDIPLLVWHFLGLFRATLNKSIDRVLPETMERLLAYDWPGNVRELRNVIERGVIISPATTLVLDDVFDAPSTSHPSQPQASAARIHGTLEQVERTYITQVLDQCAWKIRGAGQAAEQLGLHPSTLYSRMSKLGIQRAKSSSDGRRDPR